MWFLHVGLESIRRTASVSVSQARGSSNCSLRKGNWDCTMTVTGDGEGGKLSQQVCFITIVSRSQCPFLFFFFFTLRKCGNFLSDITRSLSRTDYSDLTAHCHACWSNCSACRVIRSLGQWRAADWSKVSTSSRVSFLIIPLSPTRNRYIRNDPPSSIVIPK